MVTQKQSGQHVNMKIQTWKVINANDEVIKILKCGTREAAAGKVRFFWPEDHMFLKIVKGRKMEV